MSLAALDWAWKARPKTSMQKFMLIRLADRYNGDKSSDAGWSRGSSRGS